MASAQALGRLPWFAPFFLRRAALASGLAHGVLLIEIERSCPRGPSSHPLRSRLAAAKSDPGAQSRDEEPLGVDDHPGDLAGADDLAVAADVPGGDGEAVQPAVDVRRGGGHLDLRPDRAGGEVLELDPGADAGRALGSAGSIAAQVAASHQASSRGVPSTGRLPEPTAAAVSSSVTVKVSVASARGSLRSSSRRKAISSTSRHGRPVALGRADEAEPLVEPVRGGHLAAGCESTTAVAPSLAEPVDARAGPAPRRRPRPLRVRGTASIRNSPSSSPGELAPRRARAADRDRAEDLVAVVGDGHPQLGLAVAGRGVAQVLDVGVVRARE